MNTNLKFITGLILGGIVNLIVILAVVVIPLSTLHAQPSTDSVVVMNPGTPVPTAVDAIVNLATKYPWVTLVLAAIGALRLLVKPIFTAAHAYADATDTPTDNEFIDKVENSKVLKTIVFVLDWVGSVKLIRK